MLGALMPQGDVRPPPCLLGTPSLQHKCLCCEDDTHAPGPAAVREPKCSQQSWTGKEGGGFFQRQFSALLSQEETVC